MVGKMLAHVQKGLG